MCPFMVSSITVFFTLLLMLLCFLRWELALVHLVGFCFSFVYLLFFYLFNKFKYYVFMLQKGNFFQGFSIFWLRNHWYRTISTWFCIKIIKKIFQLILHNRRRVKQKKKLIQVISSAQDLIVVNKFSSLKTLSPFKAQIFCYRTHTQFQNLRETDKKGVFVQQ